VLVTADGHLHAAVAAADAKIIVLTNGCGGLNPDWTPGTAVLIRDHINLTGATPLSGATTFVYFRRSCCWVSVARAAATRAAAVFAAVTYCATCCSLIAPDARRASPRFALAAASAAVAWASSSAARAWATSALTVSAENTASTSPLLTTSPTFTLTSSRRSPPDSLPTIASCQAATLPLAPRRSGRVAVLGRAVVTVNAGVAGAFFFSSAPRPQPPSANRIRAAAPARRRGRVVIEGMLGSVV
jgi:hypothetical protein